jgi:hypothetical protein
MTSSKLFLAATITALLSTAAIAGPPSADSVSVSQSQAGHGGHGKLQALFDNQEQFTMFRLQFHQAVKGMPKDQKKAYRKAQMKQIRSMTDAQRAGWRHDLQAKWNALPEAKKEKIAQKMANHAAKHQSRGSRQGGQDDQDMGGQQ